MAPRAAVELKSITEATIEMAQQRGMKRAAKVAKRKQKSARLQHEANVRREARGPVAQAPAHDHDHEGHDHDHEGHDHEEPKKTKKKSAKQEEE